MRAKEGMVHKRLNVRSAAGGECFYGRKRLGQALAGLLLCLGLVGCATPPDGASMMAAPKGPIPAATSPEALEAGMRMYQQHCALCHGEAESSGVAAPLDQYGHAWHHPDSYLTQTIREGTYQGQTDLSMPSVAMPSFKGILTSEEIRTLIASFKASWTPDQQRIQWDRTVRADFTTY